MLEHTLSTLILGAAALAACYGAYFIFGAGRWMMAKAREAELHNVMLKRDVLAETNRKPGFGRG